ncbi:MAG: nitroreductase family protein [Candidatus Korarchaeota archaeon]|nr:nitroreductase family protein [Candidatus Korarchaeota archaeon]
MERRDLLLEFLRTRRSIRRFRPDPVDDEIVLKILDIARFAPSGHNYQPWEFIIIRSRDTIEKLGNLRRDSRPLLNAPMGILVVCDKEITPTTYQLDGANVTMYIMLAAHALGLGTVWLHTLFDAEHVRNIQEILGIPPNKVPISLIAIGWPNERPSPKSRKPLEELVHCEKYGRKCLKQ